MRIRYAIGFGRGAHRHQLLEAGRRLGLAVLIDGPRILGIGDSQMPHFKREQRLLVGRLFTSSGQAITEFPEAKRAPPEGAPVLGGWGNYALFEAITQVSRVYRDPSGAIPVYRFGAGSDAIFVSDAELAADLGLWERATLDTRFAAHWLQFPFLRTARTGLEGVTEVLAGTAHQIRGDGSWSEARVWRPAQFCTKRAAILDPTDAATKLKEAALGVIPCGIEGDANLLRLSGGLDSSIIAACLAQSGRPFCCVNFATRSIDGDERLFARAVAEQFGLSLHEIVEGGKVRLERLSSPSFRPATNPLLLPFETEVLKAAAELRADLVIDGAGGDNLFCHLTSAAPVIDALWWSGFRAAGAATRDIALRANASWWDVLGAARKHVFRNMPWKEDHLFINKNALLKGPERHPWLYGLRAVPPGKRQHLEALVHITHFLDRTPSPVPRAHPLLAQPLMELCLRIPSWFWMSGGQNRAIARAAFADLLPKSVLDRRSKGSLQSLFTRAFEALKDEILELLMSGFLRSSGIIDGQALCNAFASNAWKAERVQLRLSEMAALELWVEALPAWRSLANGL